MTCQITLHWDSITCLMFNCRESLLSLPPCVLYWEHCGQYIRNDTPVISSHSIFQRVKDDTTFTLHFQTSLFKFFPPISIQVGRNGTISVGSSELRTKRATRTCSSLCRKKPDRAAESTQEGIIEVPKNQQIVDLLTEGDIHPRLSVQDNRHCLSLFSDVGDIQIKKHIKNELLSIETFKLYLQSLTRNVEKRLQSFSLAALLSFSMTKPHLTPFMSRFWHLTLPETRLRYFVWLYSQQKTKPNRMHRSIFDVLTLCFVNLANLWRKLRN